MWLRSSTTLTSVLMLWATIVLILVHWVIVVPMSSFGPSRSISVVHFHLLCSAAGGTGPCESSSRLFEQGWPNTLHVICLLAYSTINRVVITRELFAFGAFFALASQF